MNVIIPIFVFIPDIMVVAMAVYIGRSGNSNGGGNLSCSWSQ